MQNRFWAILFVVVYSLCVVQCANPIPLEGGLRDKTPPKIDSLRSTPNMQTNFEKQDIELTFDEWVQLNDVFRQVVISPPVEPRPDISLRGKTVKVAFDEETVLRENATYTINFGEAVQDLTERNAPDDLRFVFSTGDFIDSLEVTGTLLDVEENEPQEGVLVMLYDNLADSVVRTEKPFYFAKTNKEGRFRIQNVRADTFKVVALEDNIPNYQYDASERIGFLDAPIIVHDSSDNEIDLRLFTPATELAVLDIDSVHYGRADFIFNQSPRMEDLEFEYQDTLPYIDFEINKDTLHVWYEMGEQSRWRLIVRKDSTLSDTLRINGNQGAEFLASGAVRPYKKFPSKQTLKPAQKIGFQWNHPLADFDTAQVLLYLDSLKTPLPFTLVIDSNAANRVLQLRHAWKEDSLYNLELFPGVITDIYGLVSEDSIQQKLDIQSSKDLGNLQLQLVDLDSTQHYLLEILLGTEVVFEDKVQNLSRFEVEVRGLKAGGYSAKIITDVNKNAYWDTGDYDLKRQAEPIFIKQLEQVRANWDVEASISLKGQSISGDEEAEREQDDK